MNQPAKIMLIRHAEKPHSKPKHRPPDGVTLDGAIDENSLLVRGWQRAGALVGLFAPKGGFPAGSKLATPNQIYASSALVDKSLRPQQTVTPLADKLNLIVNNQFSPSKGEAFETLPREKELIDNVLQQPGVILISWQHELILEIVSHIPLAAGANLPIKWCSHRFDLIWVFDLQNAAPLQYSFTEVRQQLLPGDIDAPMDHPCPEDAASDAD